ncbi:hypothetical protein AB0M02_28265 [Actinoplanes sp. NPDC051861]|uniref:hypothetical protein n=1 Tax=Actinoplanes sp. NPDC051861 TaxID=3155170 RepID=UPI003427C0C2
MTAQPPPYYAPMPPMTPPFTPQPSRGLAITALAVGGTALLLSWIPGVGLVLGVVAGVFGVLGIMRSTRWMSILGTALGGVALLINVLVLAAVAFAADAVSNAESRTAAVAPVSTVPTVPAMPVVDPTTEAPSPEPTTEEPTPEPEPTTPAPSYKTPKPSHFALTVKTMSKECFGSAGCLVDYRIKVAMKSDVTFDPDKNYDITFDVFGDEDGPRTGTFTLSGDGSYVGYDLEGDLSTSSSGQKLTAKVTDIEEA